MKKLQLIITVFLILALTACSSGAAIPAAEQTPAAVSEQGAAPIRTEAPVQKPEPPRADMPETDPESAETGTAQEPKAGTDRAGEILDSMSLYEKICQMIIVRPEQLTGTGPVTESGAELEAGLEKWPVGGILYTLPNLIDAAQTDEMTSEAQRLSRLGLFICADEEGGNVGRLMYTIGTTWIDSMYSYREQGTGKAYSNALTIGTDMMSHGFNTDFAPVADVWSNPENKIIGTRAYSDDFNEAAELVSAAVSGFKSSGVICSLKHFPGHGNTAEDSHVGMAYTDKSLEELRSEEYLPFRSGIDAGADMVMVAHITVTDADDVPATMSRKIVTEELREYLGFDGVIITDGLEMAALTKNYTAEEIAVGCISAGADILLGPVDLEAAVGALKSAVESGEITQDQIDTSVRRILELKLDHGIIE